MAVVWQAEHVLGIEPIGGRKGDVPMSADGEERQQ